MLMSDFLGGMGNAVKITADVEVMAADVMCDVPLIKWMIGF